MPTAWFFLEMSMGISGTSIGASKTQRTTTQEQFVVLSFKVKFRRRRVQKTTNGCWMPLFFSAQIEIFQKN